MTDKKLPSVQLQKLQDNVAMINLTSLETVDLKAAFLVLPSYSNSQVCKSCGTETKIPEVDLNVELFVNLAKLPESLRNAVRKEMGFQFDTAMEAKFFLQDEKG